MPVPAYDLHLPDRQTASVLFASPHSGRDYPPALLAQSVLDRRAIRSSEDAFVDRLFDCAPRHGAPLLTARMPRAWVDLNRASEELDPALIDGVPRGQQNPRVASGLGVIPRVVSGGRAIYRGKITQDDARRRIRDHWQPYHDRLQDLMSDTVLAFGEALLIDCHSMPHEAIESLGGSRGRRPEVVLGDRYGASSDAAFVDLVEGAFRDAGLSVARNAPFAGAFISQHYGRPARRQHVIQVEIDRALYLDTV